jgi:hypothetical protein
MSRTVPACRYGSNDVRLTLVSSSGSELVQNAHRLPLLDCLRRWRSRRILRASIHMRTPEGGAGLAVALYRSREPDLTLVVRSCKGVAPARALCPRKSRSSSPVSSHPTSLACSEAITRFLRS